MPSLGTWKKAGKSTQAIFGLSHKGTSQQALKLSLKLFDEVFVCFPGSISTFHPKIYLFAGEARAVLFYGSHNLTSGGTETNFEAGIKVKLTLPDDRDLLDQANASINSLLPPACLITRRLDQALLARLIAEELVFDEAKPVARFGKPTKKSKTSGAALFPAVFPKPPMAVPPGLLAKTIGKALKPKIKAPPKASVVIPSEELAIQIVPHRNGEVFLSKTAVNQNPTFFCFPFTGETIPKKGSNKAYPQREPDPIVDVAIFDSTGAKVIQNTAFPLNTVFYDKKGEIRITVSPDLSHKIAPFSVLHMRMGDGSCDYYFEIYNPGSKRHEDLLASCDQILPSGGAAQSRKMGWL